MANKAWGDLYFGAGSWGEQATDVIVPVGTQSGWGRATFGEGAWNSPVPIDALSLNTGTVSFVANAKVLADGNEVQTEVCDITFS